MLSLTSCSDAHTTLCISSRTRDAYQPGTTLSLERKHLAILTVPMFQLGFRTVCFPLRNGRWGDSAQEGKGWRPRRPSDGVLVSHDTAELTIFSAVLSLTPAPNSQRTSIDQVLFKSWIIKQAISHYIVQLWKHSALTTATEWHRKSNNASGRENQAVAPSRG